MSRRFTFLACASCCVALVTARSANESPVPEGTVNSGSFEYDQKAGVLHYWENVELRYPGVLDLDCADLEIRLQSGGSKLDRILARTNVVITIIQAPSTNGTSLLIKAGATNRAYAAEAVFNGVDNTVTLAGSAATGQPRVESAEGVFKADVIVFDRAKDKFSGKGNIRMTVRPDALQKNNPLLR
jgi:lipopolysaccharide export system protein LptA